MARSTKKVLVIDGRPTAQDWVRAAYNSLFREIRNGELHECEGCGCTEITPCDGGCAWDQEALEAGRYVCTTCIEYSALRWSIYFLIGNAALMLQDGYLTRPGEEAPWQNRA